MKVFEDDIKHMLARLQNHEYFSFSKYADGEYAVLRNTKITNCDNWVFDPVSRQYERQLLLESFQYNHDNYHVGISCPCCQPKVDVEWMRDNVKTKNVTWANLFVNNNYRFFRENFFSTFNDWPGRVILISNEAGVNKKLPFKCNIFYPISIEGWLEPNLSKTIKTSKNLATEKNDQLFLFSGGPLGNILAHLLHIENQNNTYIDIGSTVNPWITGNNRGYLNGVDQKTCIW